MPSQAPSRGAGPPAGGAAASAPSSPSAGRAARGPPGVVPPSTSPRTRSGKRIASSWAIMPPIESPYACALSTPIARSRPAASAASSAIDVGRSGEPERPEPRLS